MRAKSERRSRPALPASVPAFAAIDPRRGSGLEGQRLFHAADGALAGRFHFFDRERDDLSSRSRLVRRPEDAAGARPMTPTRSTSTVATPERLAPLSTSGSRRGTTSSRSSPQPTFSRRTGVCRAWRSCDPGGDATPRPACTGPAASSWGPAACLGLGGASWRGGRTSRRCSNKTRISCVNCIITRNTWPACAATGPRPTTTSSPRRPASSRPAARFLIAPKLAGWRGCRGGAPPRGSAADVRERSQRELASSYHIFVLELLLGRRSKARLQLHFGQRVLAAHLRND